MVKYGLHFDPEKPHVFIESVKDIIETKYSNDDRAVFKKGPYQLRNGFEHFLVNILKQSSMKAVQRLNKVKEFQKGDMRSRKDYVAIFAPIVSQCGALSVTAMDNEITEGPIVILTTMFKKANELLWHEGMIVKNPGTDDGSDIVAGHTNHIYWTTYQVYCVTPGKGRSLKCDWNWVNASIRNYATALQLLQKKYVKLPDFVT